MSAYDATGSAIGARHELPLGAPVLVTRWGTPQWRDLEVIVHGYERNGAYRLRFPNGTFVTVLPEELELAR